MPMPLKSPLPLDMRLMVGEATHICWSWSLPPKLPPALSALSWFPDTSTLPYMLQDRTGASSEPHGSSNSRNAVWRLSRWNHEAGGFPVDFHAALAATALSLLTSPALSNPSVSPVEPMPLTDTSSMIAAPAVPELNPLAPLVSSSYPRLVLTRNTRRRRPPFPAPPSASRMPFTVDAGIVRLNTVGAAVDPLRPAL